MPPVQTVDDISEIAFGYMASKALFAALELELFTHVASGANTLEALAGATQTPPNRLLTLLTALTSIGLLMSEGGAYQNSPASQRFLVAGRREFYGDYLRMQINRQMYPFMQHLEAVMQGRAEQAPFDSYANWMADADEAETYSKAQHVGSLGAAAVLARAVDMSEARELLDVGGGTGAMSITLCRRNPNLRATVLDFPNVADIGRGFAQEAGLASRVRFQPGNALTETWPDAQDAVLMSYLLSSVPGDAIPGLMQRAYETLAPGGDLLLHDFFLDDDRQGPRMTALWALQHVVFTPGARSMTETDVIGPLGQIGFTNIQTQALLPGLTRLIHARKPAAA